MTHPLDGCRAKIERANKHIQDLESALKTFAEGDAYKVGSQYDAKAGILSIVFADVRDLPPEVSIVVGEALYQQRSALDHLVWQLVLRNNRTPPAKSGFPIFTTVQGYETRSPSMIEGIGPSAAARIKALQPFHRGAARQSDPLWSLQELYNTDKHRLLLIMGAHFGKAGGGWDLELSPPVTVAHGARYLIMAMTPVENGAILAQFETAARKVNMQGKISHRDSAQGGWCGQERACDPIAHAAFRPRSQHHRIVRC